MSPEVARHRYLGLDCRARTPRVPCVTACRNLGWPQTGRLVECAFADGPTIIGGQAHLSVRSSQETPKAPIDCLVARRSPAGRHSWTLVNQHESGSDRRTARRRNCGPRRRAHQQGGAARPRLQFVHPRPGCIPGAQSPIPPRACGFGGVLLVIGHLQPNAFTSRHGVQSKPMR